jgi:hypothetical protein
MSETSLTTGENLSTLPETLASDGENLPDDREESRNE